MKTNPVVVVVGLGNISRRHRSNLKILFPECEIVAVSASGRDARGLKVSDASLVVSSLEDALLNKPDFAIIASPATSHLEHSTQLMQAGIPVLVEKPVVADIEQSRSLLRICRESGTKAAVAYCLRHLSSAAAVKRLLEEQRLGTIYNAQVSIGQYLPDWRPSADFRQSVSAQKALGGGVLLELSHEFDYLQWLLGRQSIRFACLRHSKELALDVEEFADVVLENPFGVISSVHLDFHQKNAMRRCCLIGSEARLEWDLIANSVVVYDKTGRTVVVDDPGWDKNNMYLDMVRDFVNMLDDKPSSCVSVEEAINTVLLIEQIKKDAFWGKSL